MTRKIEIERFSLTTSKQFDEVIAGVNAAIGHPNMALQYPGVSSITRMGVVFNSATIHPPLRFKRAGRVCDLLFFVKSACARALGLKRTIS